MDYEIISDNKCLLGESPIWHDSKKKFIWLDYLKSEIFFYSPYEKIISCQKLDLETPLGGIALYNLADSLIVAHKRGLSILNLNTFSISDFAHPESTKKDVIYNDLKIDRQKNIWISTSHIDETENKGSLWSLDANKALRLIDTGFKVSNGPAFSPCGNYVYFNDTFSYKTYLYQFTKEENKKIYKELFYRFDNKEGYPDGITVDEDGCIWIAHWGSGIISKQSLNGEILKRINLPSKNLTSLCFGGENYNYLIATSATEGITEKDWISYPDSGKTFLIHTEERGISEKSYIG
tara:strand:- start:2216 stop:3094 length:879 start_codon:yes stop_codon:yes gene_type:complete